MQWKAKRVAVIGLGLSNMAVCRHLVSEGALVTACDQKEAAALGERYRELAALGVQFQLGRNYLHQLDRFDCLFLAPGVPKNLPAFVAARHAGVAFSSEVNLFFDLCRSPIIGITGSSGKTTTTTLIGEILKAAGYPARIGGNIGRPLLEEAAELDSTTWVVLELSSFQLELLHRSPHIALVTNVTPNHLDIHSTMSEYIAAKKNIFRFQGSGDWLLLNADCDITREMAGEAPGQVAWFSRCRRTARGACQVDGRVMVARPNSLLEVCRADEVRLLGQHNLENILAAVAVGDLAGCSAGAMRDVVTSFTGVAHRLELVREAEGVAYYNDSKATTPAGAMAALQSFDQPVVLIAGGYDKQLPFDELAGVILRKVKAVVLLGATREKIAASIAAAAGSAGVAGPPIRMVTTLEEAVAAAKGMAVAGDVVLLSPASASYDMFTSFEERGSLFREIVRSLTEVETPVRP
jgi:UDP-N-acetylmuramoylalanine--D-glutamate ligase